MSAGPAERTIRGRLSARADSPFGFDDEYPCTALRPLLEAQFERRVGECNAARLDFEPSDRRAPNSFVYDLWVVVAADPDWEDPTDLWDAFEPQLTVEPAASCGSFRVRSYRTPDGRIDVLAAPVRARPCSSS